MACSIPGESHKKGGRSHVDKPTNNDKPKLNDGKVLGQAKKPLEIYLPLEADGYRVTSETLYDILIGTAANRGTTESVCIESERQRQRYCDGMAPEFWDY